MEEHPRYYPHRRTTIGIKERKSEKKHPGFCTTTSSQTPEDNLGGPPADGNWSGREMDSNAVEMCAVDEVRLKMETEDSIKVETEGDWSSLESIRTGSTDNEMEQLIKVEHLEEKIENAEESLDQDGSAGEPLPSTWTPEESENEAAEGSLEMVCTDHHCFWYVKAKKLEKQLKVAKAKIAELETLLPETNEPPMKKRPRISSMENGPPPTTTQNNMDIAMTRRPKQVSEIFLDFVTRNGENVSPEDMRDWRFVHPTWCKAVDDCLSKSGKPLFTLTLPPTGPPEKSPEIFDDVISQFTQRTHNSPPIGLTLKNEYFAKGFERVVMKLDQYAPHLVSLSLHLEATFNVCKNPVKLKKVDFSLLQTLEIRFSVQPQQWLVLPLNRPASSHATRFVQLILCGSQNLKRFDFSSRGVDFPVDFMESLRLPEALTSLTIDEGLSNENLEGLLRSPLPKLEKLVLPGNFNPFDGELVSRTLGKCSDTLTHLTLNGNEDQCCYVTTTDDRMQLPKMTSLQTLEVLANYEAAAGCTPGLSLGDGENVPALRTLKLHRQSRKNMEEWVHNGNFKSVENLDIQLATHNLPFAVLFCDAFPSLRKLYLTFDPACREGGDVSGLDYILQNLTHLESLQISVTHGNRRSFLFGATPVGNRNWWISVLHGLSPGPKTPFHATAVFLSTINSKLERQPQIAVLPNLRKLHLAFNACQVSLPFDEVFHLGFFHMPRLQEIRLEGDFFVHKVTVAKWRESGRFLKMNNESRYLF